MTYHHFGHHHVLVQLVLEEGEQIDCKACERRIFEPFLGCLSCSFYLHDKCCLMSRSLEHPSHALHPLTFHPKPTYTTCSYVCNACGSQGSSFSYSCAHCDFDLHLPCASLPSSVLLESHHNHDLKLTFDSPCEDRGGLVYTCDLCSTPIDKACWFYYCADCDFGAHLDCAFPDHGQDLLKKCRDSRGDIDTEGNGRRGGDGRSIPNDATAKLMEVMQKASQLQWSAGTGVRY